MTLRVLIVDDTRLARQELRTLLAAMPDVECIGEADDVPAAQAAIERLHPDVVLLDIQMPSGTGFDLLERLDAAPRVVFTTAYDQFALRAFQANALDYLLKPVDAARLAEALAKARASIPAPVDAGRGTIRADDPVFLRDGERCWFVALREINRIVVDGNYVKVWFRDQRAMLARTLSALEARLDPGLFFRANRSQIINLDFIESVEVGLGGRLHVQLRGGPEVEISRRQAQLFRRRTMP